MVEFFTNKRMVLLATIIVGAAVSGYFIPAEAARLIGTNNIADGAITTPKLAADAVTSNQIADGTVGYADVSRGLVAVEFIADCNCGSSGWDPDGTSNADFIYDARIQAHSVVVVTPMSTQIICSTYNGNAGHVVVWCNSTIPNGMSISYAIFNNPAFG